MGDAHPIDVHLGLKLRRRRRNVGMTQKTLAALCGLRFQQVQKYECADNRMSAARLWQFAEVLEVTLDYFYEGLEREASALGSPAGQIRDLEGFDA